MAVGINQAGQKCLTLTIDFFCIGIILSQLVIASGEDFTVFDGKRGKLKKFAVVVKAVALDIFYHNRL